MFVKWPKTFRILVSQIDVKGKHFLSDAETKALLSGNVSITEKCDGANVALIRNKNDFRLQKRGSLVGDSEHLQFQRFKAWSFENYDKIMGLPTNTLLYGEWCYATHTIYYDRLPDYFLAFALYDKKTNSLCHRDDLAKLCEKLGFFYTPEVARGFYNREELFDLIPKISNFGTETAEGIVVENLKHRTRGKLVLRKFQESMEEDGHWSNKEVRKNLLKMKGV